MHKGIAYLPVKSRPANPWKRMYKSGHNCCYTQTYAYLVCLGFITSHFSSLLLAGRIHTGLRERTSWEFIEVYSCPVHFIVCFLTFAHTSSFLTGK